MTCSASPLGQCREPFLLPANSSSGRRAVYSKSQQTVVRVAAGGNGGNIGFHDIPYQTGTRFSRSPLGQALCGGCVRQAADDAIWMWNWADIGTVVVVTP